jgi:hypothetical protein
MPDITKNHSEIQAAVLYVLRKRRIVHPDGTFDKAQRWDPSENEHCACCNPIRAPTRAWPYSYMTHCRTLVHTATLLQASDITLARKYVKELEHDSEKLQMWIKKIAALKLSEFKLVGTVGEYTIYKSRKKKDGTSMFIRIPAHINTRHSFRAGTMNVNIVRKDGWSTAQFKANIEIINWGVYSYIFCTEKELKGELMVELL